MTTKGAKKDLDELDKKMSVLKDKLAKELFGRTLSEAHNTHTCVSCVGPATHFKDDKSAIEWRISGLCQFCQDYAEGVEEIGKDSPQKL